MDKQKYKEYLDLKNMLRCSEGDKEFTAFLSFLYFLSLALPEDAPPHTRLQNTGHKGFPVFALLFAGLVG